MADLHATADLHDNAAVAPRRLFAWMALAAAALTFVVIVASAWMRHAHAGLSCPDWPACYARVSEAIPDAPPGAGARVARIMHRVAATGVGALILGMLLIAWTQRPIWRRECAAATGAALIVTGLAVLGTFTPGARLPAVVLGNLLGGYTLLAVLCAAHAVAAPAPPTPGLARWWALAALVLAFVQAGLGGLIGAQFAALACPDATSCGAWTWRQFVAGGAWDALRTPVVVDGVVAPPAGAAALHVLHRLWSIALAVAVLGVVQSMRQTRPADRGTARGCRCCTIRRHRRGRAAANACRRRLSQRVCRAAGRITGTRRREPARRGGDLDPPRPAIAPRRHVAPV